MRILAGLPCQITWVDERAGRQEARPEMLGDVVLMRKDAPASYHLAVTLDDAADGVTLVTRGMIAEDDVDLLRLADTPEEAVELVLTTVPVSRWPDRLADGDLADGGLAEGDPQ